MKKVLSLLLVCTMILSLSAIMVANATGEGYTIVAAQVGTKKVGPSTKLNFDATATTYNSYTHYTDASWEVYEDAEAIALQISTDTAASGGYVSIEYDTTKVVPAAITYADGSVYGQTYNALAAGGLFGNYAWVQTTGKATITESTEATAVNNGNLVVTWTGAMSAGDVICYVTFFGVNGKTSSDFDADTFKIASNSEFLEAYKLKNGGASLDYQGTTYKLKEGTLTTSLTYPNSDKVVGVNVAATNVVLDKTAATINTIGETVTLTATVKGANDVNATNQNVTWTTDKESVATVANGVVTAVADGTATITATSEDGNFTATCVITVDADWEAGAATDETAWNNAFKFKDTASSENGKTYEGKKLVIFGKNSTTTALAAESYGVKIGNNEYPGIAEVPAGKAWAIIIIDSNGQKVALDNYSYTAYVGDKTVFSGNVNAQ